MAERSTIEQVGMSGWFGTPLELLVMANQVFVRYPLPGRGTLTVGRGSGVDISVEDPMVSRRHARIHVAGNVEIEDLGGQNGTLINRRKLGRNERTVVEPGVAISIGQAVLLVQPQTSERAYRCTVEHASDAGSSAINHIPPHIVIANEQMRKIYGLAAQAARSPINVLILGETGSGKEMLAQTIHACSERAQGPFITLNCSTFSETLLESELFGHEKGAFTNASQAKAGLLEVATGGTVFLDEIGDMAPAIQARMLRVLEVPEVRRVGGLKSRPIDIRIVAATNRDLAAAVTQGKFRQDLYFRLNVLTVRLPPLRERRGEIQPLAVRFVAAASQAMSRRREPALTAEALALLEEYDWPGNVRELRNVIFRAVLFCGRQDILAEHIQFDELAVPAPPAPRVNPGGGPRPSVGKEVAEFERRVNPGGGPRPSVGKEVAEFERQRIVAALEARGGNQSKAADDLGMSRRTLLNRLDKLGLPRPRGPRLP